MGNYKGKRGKNNCRGETPSTSTGKSHLGQKDGVRGLSAPASLLPSKPQSRPEKTKDRDTQGVCGVEDEGRRHRCQNRSGLGRPRVLRGRECAGQTGANTWDDAPPGLIDFDDFDPLARHFDLM